jgi:glycosyltransferase involved in cell wall biosynthesis
MIQLAGRFLMFQKERALALWDRARTVDIRVGTRKTMIVALARKLVIALCRFVITGEPLEGVVLRPSAYIRLSERRPLGAKRNLACEIARGEIIAHWDDDDWYAPDRLSRQAALLTDSGASLCGLDTVLFYDLRSGEAWPYVYPRTSGHGSPTIR